MQNQIVITLHSVGQSVAAAHNAMRDAASGWVAGNVGQELWACDIRDIIDDHAALLDAAG